jgi:uncharacterized transporter YbjL
LALFFVIFVLVVVVIIVSWVKNWRAAKRAGLDPLAIQGQLAGQLANSQLLQGSKSIEERLDELDDLHARGVISAEEYTEARKAAIAEG